MQKIKERINVEILSHLIDEYATAKEGDLIFKNEVTFPSTTKENLESIRNEIINLIERNGNEKVELSTTLTLIDENSNIDKLVKFNYAKKEQEIYQGLLSKDDGENASKLAELASEKANEEYVDLLDLVKLDAEILYN
jgi:hypothetical protein